MSIAEKIITIAENEQKVYEAGKNAEWSKLWDDLQNNGTLENYNYFASYKEKIEWFRPKYDIRPTTAQYFARDLGDGINFSNTSDHVDLVEVLNECGVVMDFSKATNVTYLFYQSRFSHLPEINVSSATNGVNALMFGQCVRKIDKFIYNGQVELTQTFGYAGRLEEITFGCEIGNNLIISASKKLNHASILNIFEMLSNTVTGKTLELSLTAVNNAFETAEGLADGSTSTEWTTLIATKTNWTISLV